MAAKRDVLCLFDIDGTLTPSRLVSCFSLTATFHFIMILYGSSCIAVLMGKMTFPEHYLKDIVIFW